MQKISDESTTMMKPHLHPMLVDLFPVSPMMMMMMSEAYQSTNS